MVAILNSLNAHNLSIFQPILITLVSTFMVHRGLSDKTYLSLGLQSPLISMAIHLSPIDSRRVIVRIKRTWPIIHNKVETY